MMYEQLIGQSLVSSQLICQLCLQFVMYSQLMVEWRFQSVMYEKMIGQCLVSSQLIGQLCFQSAVYSQLISQSVVSSLVIG